MSDPDSVYKQLALTCRALENKHDQHELTKKALASATADVERLQKRVEDYHQSTEELWWGLATILSGATPLGSISQWEQARKVLEKHRSKAQDIL